MKVLSLALFKENRFVCGKVGNYLGLGANHMAKKDRSQISIYVSSDLHKALKMLSVAQDKDIADIYEEAMRDIIEKYGFKVTIKSPN